TATLGDIAWRYRSGRSSTDHRHALDLDQHARAREVRYRDEGACGIIAVRKEALAQLHESVAVPRVVDEHRHGHEIGEATAAALERLVDQTEDRAHLRLELSGNVVAGVIARRCLPGEPDDPAALGDDGRRVGTRGLELGLIQIFRHDGSPGLVD